jgi:hypothetical protein
VYFVLCFFSHDGDDLGSNGPINKRFGARNKVIRGIFVLHLQLKKTFILLF